MAHANPAETGFKGLRRMISSQHTCLALDSSHIAWPACPLQSTLVSDNGL